MNAKKPFIVDINRQDDIVTKLTTVINSISSYKQLTFEQIPENEAGRMLMITDKPLTQFTPERKIFYWRLDNEFLLNAELIKTAGNLSYCEGNSFLHTRRSNKEIVEKIINTTRELETCNSYLKKIGKLITVPILIGLATLLKFS